MIHTQKKSGFHACANLKSRSSYSISRLISKLLLVRLVILVINVVSTEGAVAGAPLYTLPAGEGSKENPTWAHNKLPQQHISQFSLAHTNECLSRSDRCNSLSRQAHISLFLVLHQICSPGAKTFLQLSPPLRYWDSHTKT